MSHFRMARTLGIVALALCAPQAAVAKSTPEPQPRLVIKKLEPPRGSSLDRDSVIQAELEYTTDTRRVRPGLYFVAPMFETRTKTNFNMLDSFAQGLEIKEPSGVIQVRYPIQREWDDAKLAQPVKLRFYLVNRKDPSESERWLVVAKSEQVAYDGESAAAPEIPAPVQATVPAGGTKATGASSSGDDFFYGLCIDAETKHFQTQEHKEAMARAMCQIIGNDWKSHGCQENPGQDACKRPLRALDGDLRESGTSMLSMAAFSGQTDICAAMISMGSDPNAAIANGWTPLLFATAENKPGIVRLLLDRGANPNVKNSLGRTPTMFAANYGYTNIVEMLAKASADLDAKPTDEDGKPALIAAASNGHATTVAALLRLGARADAMDAKGFTALMVASGVSGSLEVMRALLDGGADINAGVPVGTPLATASSAGRADAVKLLLERGADVNRSYRFEGLEGITPLMVGASEGHEDVVQLLIAHGADLNVRNSRGASALVHAKMASHERIVDILRKAGARE